MTTPTVTYQFVVDQGGASFTGHLVRTEQTTTTTPFITSDGTAKARALLQNMDSYERLRQFAQDPFLGSLVDRQAGTFEDYSNCEPARYPEIAQLLACCYELTLAALIEKHCEPGTTAASVRKTVRQTGKIRAKLLQPDEATRQRKKHWDEAMKSALGEGWDYALLPTDTEAYLEGKSFFNLNDLCGNLIAPIHNRPDSVAGVGVGSSSTQVYTVDADGDLRVAFDSFTGCKPTAAEKAAADAGNAKSATAFEAQFTALFRQAFGKPGKDPPAPAKRLYCHGAFGYVVNEFFHPSVSGQSKLREAVMNGHAIDIQDFHAACNALAAARPDLFETNLLLGFSGALSRAAPNIESVMIKAKENRGYHLTVAASAMPDLVLSWVRAGVVFGFQPPIVSSDGKTTDSPPAGAAGQCPANHHHGDRSPHASKKKSLVQPGRPLPASSAAAIAAIISTDNAKPVSNVRVVGITGGIASGKAGLLRFLKEELRYPVVEAEKIGQQACYQPDSQCYQEIIKEFGRSVLAADGRTVDRRKLGKLVYSDSSRLETLCRLTMPRIRQRILREVQGIRQRSEGRQEEEERDRGRAALDFIFVEAAILVDAGWTDIFDEIWTVTVPEHVACKRLMVRNRMSEPQALSCVRAQVSNAEREKHATRVLRSFGGGGGVAVAPAAAAAAAAGAAAGAAGAEETTTADSKVADTDSNSHDDNGEEDGGDGGGDGGGHGSDGGGGQARFHERVRELIVSLQQEAQMAQALKSMGPKPSVPSLQAGEQVAAC